MEKKNDDDKSIQKRVSQSVSRFSLLLWAECIPRPPCAFAGRSGDGWVWVVCGAVMDGAVGVGCGVERERERERDREKKGKKKQRRKRNELKKDFFRKTDSYIV